MNSIFSKGVPILLSASRYDVFRKPLLTNSFYFGAVSNVENFARLAPFHSCTIFCQSTDEVPKQSKKAYRIRNPVDWLPFEWNRRPRRNYFEDSGDLVQNLEYDPSWPKPDFELSDELKTASEDVKQMFSLATASKFEIKEAIKRRILARVQRHPNDFDSIEVKIALRTIQIRSLFEHGQFVKKDISGGRRILDILIKKRFRLMKILYRMDIDRFNWLAEELQLTYTPEKLGGIREMYCKKWDLRRLTKEYCKNTIKNKNAEYHKELKMQQDDFLKEKEEILAWIEKEEKELANLTL